MSLNRYEQALFGYWESAVDERRHWQHKVADLARSPALAPGELARILERELWDHLTERASHVPALRTLGLSDVAGPKRVSLLNLAEYMLRLWGPPPRPRKAAGPHE